jgi:hypothetical protein
MIAWMARHQSRQRRHKQTKSLSCMPFPRSFKILHATHAAHPTPRTANFRERRQRRTFKHPFLSSQYCTLKHKHRQLFMVPSGIMIQIYRFPRLGDRCSEARNWEPMIVPGGKSCGSVKRPFYCIYRREKWSWDKIMELWNWMPS